MKRTSCSSTTPPNLLLNAVLTPRAARAMLSSMALAPLRLTPAPARLLLVDGGAADACKRRARTDRWSQPAASSCLPSRPGWQGICGYCPLEVLSATEKPAPRDSWRSRPRCRKHRADPAPAMQVAPGGVEDAFPRRTRCVHRGPPEAITDRGLPDPGQSASQRR